MKNPAREKFLPQLSPYVDGELSPEERQQVEQHLQSNKESAAQVADFRAADALMRHAIDLQADDVDWKKFADDVMAKVSPEELPFFERLKITLSEMYLYQRGTLVAGLVGAAVAIAITVPLLISFNGPPEGYANSKVAVQQVTVEEAADIRPVVMETDQGDAIIWTIDAKEPGKATTQGPVEPDGGGTQKKKKQGSEENEEELTPQEEGPL